MNTVTLPPVTFSPDKTACSLSANKNAIVCHFDRRVKENVPPIPLETAAQRTQALPVTKEQAVPIENRKLVVSGADSLCRHEWLKAIAYAPSFGFKAQFIKFLYQPAPVPHNQETIHRDIKNWLSPEYQYYFDNAELLNPPSFKKLDNSGVDIPVRYRDKDLILVNKPSGLIMMPMINRQEKSVMGALIEKYPEQEALPSGGFVHRLDIGTSGVCVAARNLAAHCFLTLGTRDKTKIYHCIVEGRFDQQSPEGVIKAGVPSRSNRKVLQDAETRYRVIRQYQNHSLVECTLVTGRKHQIRLHMQSIGHPIVGDYFYNPKYRHKKRRNKPESPITAENSPLNKKLAEYSHPALHARSIKLIHPGTGDELTVKSPYPDDFRELEKLLKRHCLATHHRPASRLPGQSEKTPSTPSCISRSNSVNPFTVKQ